MLFVITSITLFLIAVSFWVNNSNTKFIYRNLKKNRDLDDRRYERIEHIAKLVVESQIAMDKKNDEISKMLSTQHNFLDSNLQQLQALVNSDMMSARRDELIRTKELKIALERIVTLTTLSRQQPDSSYILAIESATSRIETLETILGVRTYSPS